MPDNQDLGGQAQAIRDMMDGKLPSADQRRIMEPPVEDNQPPVQRASNPPLVDPGNYNSSSVK
jgi:hypothetical protein